MKGALDALKDAREAIFAVKAASGKPMLAKPKSMLAKAEKQASSKHLGPSKHSLGGQARAAKLSPERRAEIARKAAQARWGL